MIQGDSLNEKPGQPPKPPDNKTDLEKKQEEEKAAFEKKQADERTTFDKQLTDERTALDKRLEDERKSPDERQQARQTLAHEQEPKITAFRQRQADEKAAFEKKQADERTLKEEQEAEKRRNATTRRNRYLVYAAFLGIAILVWIAIGQGWWNWLTANAPFVKTSLILVGITLVLHELMLSGIGPAAPQQTSATATATTQQQSPELWRQIGMWSLILGKDRRWSTSRFQAIAWTYVVFFALGSLAFIPGTLQKLLETGLQPEYLVLLGSPAAAALLAAKFTTDKVNDGTLLKPAADTPTNLPGTNVGTTSASGATTATDTAATGTSGVPPATGAPSNPGNLITGDDGRADIFDFQYLGFNLIALVYFFQEFLANSANGLPSLPETLVALTGGSALGYTTKKYVETDSWPRISSVSPDHIVLGQDTTLFLVGTNFGDETPPNIPPLCQVLLNGRPLTRDPINSAANLITEWDPQLIQLALPTPQQGQDPQGWKEEVEKEFSIPTGNSADVELKVYDRYGHPSQPITRKVSVR